ncbi:Zeatin O-xylosyltransferase [Hibiscus syriacus]|uniref:Glycosyltransferase n=1 Tax=Hibiscus syriacus TaxID=106335 RepID=A0A6A3D506_HIBSY|nr:zeatin O-glucosyltransferase-like [Hibiscus syriacus]XP_039070057.1 zeatin O-glucosyltransferase-like [Hibiscus syriacus]KAE8734382.1 Zeatin O-xylosyltransferase [Hibiscus syriacus]
MSNHENSVAVVMVPFPAQGHLNQLLHLSRIILSYGIPVHYVGTSTHNRQANVRVHGWDPVPVAGFHFHDFQVPQFSSPPPDPDADIKFPSHLQPCFDACWHIREPVGELLRKLSSRARRVIIIHDSMMGSVVQDAGSIPNAESYTFHTVSAFSLFFYVWESMGKPQVNAEMPDVPSLDGCFTKEFSEFIAMQHKFLNVNAGSIYNTSKVIEGTYLELLENMRGKQLWALGPLNPLRVPEKDSSCNRHHCLEWLDKQAINSVLYVSFGTTTTMGDEQIQELAFGLRRSNQTFIWVLRDADKGDVFRGEVRRPELPNGYVDSVKDKGLVVRDWAPQLEILAHPAIGGFLSHCGWNSCMESITMGVPIGAWPMHSDQPRNAELITKLLKIGITVKDWAHRDEKVTADVVEDAVRRLMASKEGDEVRKGAAELRERVRQSVGEGEVSKEWDSFITRIIR